MFGDRLVATVLLADHPRSDHDHAPHRTTGFTARTLQVLTFVTVALSPNEGYIHAANGNLGKLAPGLLVVAWLATLVHQRRLPEHHPVHGPLAALATVVVASTAANMGNQPYALEYLIRWIPFLAITTVLVDVVSREVSVRLVLVAALSGATVAAGGALVSFLFIGNGRAQGPLTDPNDLAYVLVAALPLLVAVIPTDKRPRWVIPLAVGVAVLLALGAAATLSRGGGIALLAAAAVLALRKVVPVKVIVGVVAGIALALLAVFVVAQPVVASALGQKSFVASANVEDRSVRWQNAAKMFSAEPLLGVGPGGFRYHYSAVSHDAEPAEPNPVAHNMYVEVAAELGVFGFASFVMVIGAGLLASERALRRGATPSVVFGIQASLVAILVASAFLSEEYYMPLWSTIALGCALQIRATAKP